MKIPKEFLDLLVDNNVDITDNIIIEDLFYEWVVTLTDNPEAKEILEEVITGQ